MSKKRILSFQTPKKKTATPLRVAKKPKALAEPAGPGLESLENKLVESYREENAMLRSMKADALLYNRLLGITITEEQMKINFTIERKSSTGERRLQFFLEDRDPNYVFNLEDSVNCNVPEYFYDVIEFDKEAFPLFFYKAMQAVYETRTNE